MVREEEEEEREDRKRTIKLGHKRESASHRFAFFALPFYRTTPFF
jgi:hypothetical protein